MKRIFIFLAVLSLFCIQASAETLYEQTLEGSGFEKVERTLGGATREYLEEYGIDPYNSDWIKQLTAGNLFTIIFDFLKSGAGNLGGALAVNIAVLLLWAVCGTFTDAASAAGGGVNTAFTAILTLSIIVPVLRLITSVSSAIKAGGVFMLSFVPLFCGITAATGNVATAAGSSALLLTAAEVTVQIIAFLIIPIASAELALAVSGSFSDVSPAMRLSLSIKKATGYIMTLTFTVFLGLLSIQTAISGAGDSVSLKAVKFMVGSFVPVAGSALSETISALGGSVKILQSGVGVYGIFAVLFTVLPVAAELILWRFTFFVGKAAGDMLGVGAGTKIITAVDNTVALLLGTILFVGALFIIALAVVLRVGV